MQPLDKAIRLSVTIGVISLALIALSTSYQHAYSLGLALGEQRSSAQLIPLTLDGMMFVAALVGLFASRYDLPQPSLARYAFGLGIAATLAVNCASGATRGFWAAVFDAWPAVALILSMEMAFWLVSAHQSLSAKTLVVVDTHETEDKLADAVALLAKDKAMSAAELGRTIGVSYDKALKLHREARQLLHGRLQS